MIEVEDTGPHPQALKVSMCAAGTEVCIEQTLDVVQFHKDAWPALKAAVDDTLKQAEAKPIIQMEDRNRAYAILKKLATDDYLPFSAILNALERGYV